MSLGFTETLLWMVPDIGLPPRECASLVNLLVFASVFISARWTIRIQYFILAIIALSLVSFFWGAIDNFSLARLEGKPHAGLYARCNHIHGICAVFPRGHRHHGGRKYVRRPAKTPAAPFRAERSSP